MGATISSNNDFVPSLKHAAPTFLDSLFHCTIGTIYDVIAFLVFKKEKAILFALKLLFFLHRHLGFTPNNQLRVKANCKARRLRLGDSKARSLAVLKKNCKKIIINSACNLRRNAHIQCSDDVCEDPQNFQQSMLNDKCSRQQHTASLTPKTLYLPRDISVFLINPY